jgi:hypothetical protein
MPTERVNGLDRAPTSNCIGKVYAQAFDVLFHGIGAENFCIFPFAFADTLLVLFVQFVQALPFSPFFVLRRYPEICCHFWYLVRHLFDVVWELRHPTETSSSLFAAE